MASAKTMVNVPGELKGSVRVPASKSYTHRAVLMASLAVGTSRIVNPLLSRDTIATIGACEAMGASIQNNGSSLEVGGGKPETPGNVVDVQNSGTTLRFMTSAFSLAPEGYTVLTGDQSIRRRPMQPLLDALRQLGVEARSTRGNGCAPIFVKAGGMRGGEAEVNGDVSSQFISSIIASSPMARTSVKLKVAGAVSRPYIEATMAVASRFGVKTERNEHMSFSVEAPQQYKACSFTVPGDFSSASFIAASVAMVGGRVELRGVDSALPQGDSAILEVLSSMGVRIAGGKDSVIVESDGKGLGGGRFDLTDMPDLLPVISVLALKSDAPVEIVGAAHARYKETDRIGVVTQELTKLGVDVEERGDGMLIQPQRKLNPATLDAHDDHRMFMAFSLASMLFPEGVPVLGVESLDVSYPSFLEDIGSLGASVTRENS